MGSPAELCRVRYGRTQTRACRSLGAGLPYGGRGVRERLYLLDAFDQIREYFGDV